MSGNNARRRFIAQIGAAALGLAAGQRAALAQPSTPAAGEFPPLPAAWAAAWSSGDPEQLLMLYTEDARYQEIPTGGLADGREAMRAFFEAKYATFSDIQVTPIAGFESTGGGWLEGDFAGRYTGQIPGLATGAGQPFSVPFAVVFETDGRLIRRSADYFDLYGLFMQIGVLGTPTQ
jgi:steroid delta-isomerase-like uncharacterized protein